MYRYKALGDPENAKTAALGGLARDLSDEEYGQALAAGLLDEEAQALFEHEADAEDSPARTGPRRGKGDESRKDGE